MSDLWEYGGNTDDSETSSNSSDGAVGGAGLESYIAPEKLKRMQTYFTATGGACGPSGSRGLGRKRELAEVVNEFEEDEEEERGWAAGFGAGGGDDELGSIPAYADVVDEEAAKAQHVLQNCLRGGHEEEEEEDEEDEYSDIEDDDAILYTGGTTSGGVQQGNGVVDDASIRSIRLHLIDADKHEFYVNAVVESTFEYPFSKFEEHAKQEGWLQETQGVKYVLEGDPIDPAMNTPHDFDLEDGDIIEVYYYTR
ncbi:hypothetical protein PSENEW3n2_00001898 [Picochlorum sp. SENEW3]|nr:hypothetical protein PSENEW3n2_00001898 [Picochlorum sp. SENEW3]WPT14668.1 hypothetical protein PSENEW3_00001898 [Picochlorum sp. SENEW3]